MVEVVEGVQVVEVEKQRPIRASMSFSAVELVFLSRVLSSVGPRDWSALRELSDDPTLDVVLRKVQTMRGRVDESAAALRMTRFQTPRAEAHAIRAEYREMLDNGVPVERARLRIRRQRNLDAARLRCILSPLTKGTGKRRSARDEEQEAAE